MVGIKISPWKVKSAQHCYFWGLASFFFKLPAIPSLISEVELRRLIFSNQPFFHYLSDKSWWPKKVQILILNSERHRHLLYWEVMELATKHKLPLSISRFFTFSSHLMLLKTGQDGSLETWLGWAEPYWTISEWTKPIYINCCMYLYSFRMCTIVFKWEPALYLINITLVKEFYAFTGNRNTVKLGETEHF